MEEAIIYYMLMVVALVFLPPQPTLFDVLIYQ